MYDPVSHNLLVKILQKYDQKQLDDVFRLRLSAGFQTIFENFHRLYPLRSDVWEHLEQLVDILIQAHLERKPQAIRLDDERGEDLHWFLSQKIVGMMLYVDLFNDDLKGLLDKLDYLEDLGVNFVHVMPILKRPAGENDGGYAVSDYRSLDPKYGTMADLERLSKAFRERGILLMLDIVINHTADDHDWAMKAKAGELAYQDFYYCYKDRSTPDHLEQSMPQVFPDTAPGNFTFIEEMDQWVMTVFHNYQWDLNYTNPAVFNAMLENLLFLANKGADVLRLDALAFMWKQFGTTGQNLPQAHLLVQTFKSCMQIARPGTIFLAEAIVAPEEIIKYFGVSRGVSNECDIAYNATLMTLLWETVATKNNKLLKVSLDNIPKKPEGTTWITYLRCHDDIGLGYEDQHATWAGYDAPTHRRFIIDYLTNKINWSFSKGFPFMEDHEKGDARISGSLASLAGLEKAIDADNQQQIEIAVQRIIMLHAVILAYGGIPMLYMGDEIGLLNDYGYLEDEGKKMDNRWMHRPKMKWEKVENVNVNDTIEGQIFQTLKKLIATRKERIEFADHNDTYLIHFGNEHILGFGRYHEHQKIICVFNLNDHEEWFPVNVLEREGVRPEYGLLDLATGFSIDQPFEQIRLQAHQFHWITQQRAY